MNWFKKNTSVFLFLVLLLIIVGFTSLKTEKPNRISNTPQKYRNTINENTKPLDWESFKERAKNPDSVVIDIRTPEEIMKGKLFEDSLEINYYDSSFEDKIAKLDREKTYLIYCRSGNRTSKSIPIFERYGLKVFDLKGGYLSTIQNKSEL